ncbi:MAG TPA: SpoIID/LytB domain-containing protein [Patescibacteria group bacterium]
MKQTLRKTAFTVALCSLMGAGLVIPSASAEDGELDKARAETAFYKNQQNRLVEEQAVSKDDIKLAEARLRKQTEVVEASNRKLEAINAKLVDLKYQRGEAMEEAYVSSDNGNLLYALVDSGSLSEFLRRGQYTTFLIDRKEDLVDRLDGEIAGLDGQRRDLVTDQNALESEIKDLEDRIALLKLQLEANGDKLGEAEARERALAERTGFENENDRDFIKRNQPVGDRFALAGGGTEHGLGMSQYGAKGAAQHGRDYRDILAHYYQGSRIIKAGTFSTNMGSSEEYVARVVAGEMPSSWPMEALKAQAVAARSYAYRNRGNQDCSPRTQACGSGSARAREAVRATSGQVLSHDGSVIAAYYHSTSGGWTENNENVWGGTPLGWLRGVSSPWETDSPHWYWESKSYSRNQMQAILNQDARTNVGRLETIRIIGRGVSGRVTSVQVVGSGGTKTVSGPRFKGVFNAYSPADEPGLRSTLFGFR